MASLIKRNGTFYLQWYVGAKIRRQSLRTKTLQVAKEKLRQFQSAQHRGIDDSLPTRTPIADVITAYVDHIRDVKTPKSAQTDVYYLREAFGPICPSLQITSRRVTENSRRRLRKPGQDRRCRQPIISADYFESITTADVATFIHAHKRSRGLAPKTANRYREIIVRIFNWAIKHEGIRMPGGSNPAAVVERFKEPAPEIRYLDLPQIDEQLSAFHKSLQIQAMVATLIYAGLRRAELLWLTHDDVRLINGGQGVILVCAKSVYGEFWQPKTKQNRAIPISTALRTFLNLYSRCHSTSQWYFPSPTGARWDEDNFSARLREQNRSFGLNWTCLDYRHTFGSQLAQKGLSLFKISSLMGNSPQICRKHYSVLDNYALSGDISF